MALLCFSLTVTIGSVMVLRSKGRSFWLAGFVFALALIRFLVPFEFGRAYVIDCLHIYPGFMYLLWRELWPGFSVGLGLVLVWTAVAVGKLLWLGRTLYRQHQIVRQCRVLSEETPLSRLCRRAAGDVGCRRPIQVGISSQVSTAMLAGFRNPAILLPANLSQLSEQQQYYILLHELCHYKKRDLWVKLGIQFFCCLLWWNPLVYLLKSSVDQLLELRCDRQVCSLLPEGGVFLYSSTLLEVLRMGRPSSDPLTAKYLGIPTQIRIRQRFALLLQKKRPCRHSPASWLAAALCVVLFVGSYAVIFQPFYSPPASEQYVEPPVDMVKDFILRYEDGRMEYWTNLIPVCNVTSDMLSTTPYCDMQIYDAYTNPERVFVK